MIAKISFDLDRQNDDIEDSLCAISSLLLEAARTKANSIQVYNILIEQGVGTSIAK